MTRLPERIQKLIESVDFEKKEAYIYLKNGVTLFMKGEIKAVKAGVLISDIGEETIISWNSIAGFKILKKVIPKEKKEVKSTGGLIVTGPKDRESLEKLVAKVKEDTANVEEDVVDSEALGMERVEAREGYDDR